MPRARSVIPCLKIVLRNMWCATRRGSYLPIYLIYIYEIIFSLFSVPAKAGRKRRPFNRKLCLFDREKLPTSVLKLMAREVQVTEDLVLAAVVVAAAVAEATAGVAVTPRGEAEDRHATLPATADHAPAHK